MTYTPPNARHFRVKRGRYTIAYVSTLGSGIDLSPTDLADGYRIVPMRSTPGVTDAPHDFFPGPNGEIKQVCVLAGRFSITIHPRTNKEKCHEMLHCMTSTIINQAASYEKDSVGFKTIPDLIFALLFYVPMCFGKEARISDISTKSGVRIERGEPGWRLYIDIETPMREEARLEAETNLLEELNKCLSLRGSLRFVIISTTQKANINTRSKQKREK